MAKLFGGCSNLVRQADAYRFAGQRAENAGRSAAFKCMVVFQQTTHQRKWNRKELGQQIANQMLKTISVPPDGLKPLNPKVGFDQLTG